jgi:hypothetical protein
VGVGAKSMTPLEGIDSNSKKMKAQNLKVRKNNKILEIDKMKAQNIGHKNTYSNYAIIYI